MKRLNNLALNSDKKQQGFTLIELVVVIVILGILAVTAAPKFIDLTSDAKVSVVEAVRGSINSAMDMAHAKALVAGETNLAGSVSVAGTSITLRYGWPATDSMAGLLELDDAITEVSGTAGSFKHEDEKDGASATADYCRAVYTNAVPNKETRPSVGSQTDGC